MRNPRLLYWLTAYYLGLCALLVAAAAVRPDIGEMLPIGGVQALLAERPEAPLASVEIGAARVEGLVDSLGWLIAAIAGSLLAALPASWTYMEVRARQEYDQSMVQTIVILPIVVTAIVIIVHNSLALAFSLAGIAAGVRFRNALKSPGDVLFILLAIGIGLAGGIGAVELAIVLSIAFNYVFLILWINDYGARRGMRRFVRKAKDEADAPEESGGGEGASADADRPAAG